MEKVDFLPQSAPQPRFRGRDVHDLCSWKTYKQIFSHIICTVCCVSPCLGCFEEKTLQSTKHLGGLYTQTLIFYLNCISFLGETLGEMEATSQQVGVDDIRLAEMDVRFQCLETANYEGVLLWKETDYARRKQDAFQNRVSLNTHTYVYVYVCIQ